MDNVLIDPSDERQILDFRPLGFRDVIVLGRYSYARAHVPLEDHNHGDMIEICFLESGQQTYVVGEETFDLTGGDLFVTFPGERHGSGNTPEGKGVLFWMLIHVPEGRGRFLALPAAETRTILQRLQHLPARHFRGNEGLKKSLYQILNAYERSDDPLYITNLRNLMLRFLLDLLDACWQSQPTISHTILTVQQYIEENISEMLTAKQLAQHAGLSTSRFKARFKQEVGTPPADYVMRQKTERAKQLLQSGHENITSVAMQLGFSTPAYFATVFKRYTGQSPRSYRERNRPSHPNRLT